jgi:nitrite reductase (NO-forming)
MTFNGTVPGPLIFAEKGEVLNVTLRNEGDIVHSLNFHAAFGPSQALSGSVEQGSSKSWTMRLDFPGAFLYHCDGDNLNGMWEHVASGMYGGIVVREESDPVGNEFYVAFSEIYGTKSHPPFLGNASMPGSTNASTFDIEKFLARQPDLVLTNGMAFKHIPFAGTQSKMVLNSDAEVFHVGAGQPTTWYLFNAGPRNPIAFNFGGGLVQISSAGEEPVYDEVLSIPPGSGTTLQVTFPEPGAYFGNDHDAASLLYGSGFVVIAE